MADEFTPVALIDKNGDEYMARSATEVTNLVYGMGYKPKENKTIEEITGQRTGKDSPKPEKGVS